MASSPTYLFEEDFDDILQDLNLDDPTQDDVQPVRPTQSSDSSTISPSQLNSWMTAVLKDVNPSFSFYKSTKNLEKDTVKVTGFGTLLDEQLRRCIVKKSKVSGANREASQRVFFNLVSGGMAQLTALTGNHQLTTWVTLQVFNKMLDAEFSGASEKSLGGSASPISSAELDVAHYIGGCVISKLRKRKKGNSQKEVLGHFVSDEAPQEGTLLHAKSRGKLTNITADAKAMFVEMEHVFRDSYADFSEVNEENYKSACYKSTVIQDCYFNSVHASENTDHKDQILSDILHLYFKIRIHHKCKIILDSVRAKTKVSSKDKALRSKLAK